jgi:hypothetical protein
VYVSGNYAYLATASNAAELTVVNVTNPAAPVLADTLDLGNTVDGQSVFVSGTYAYVGKLVSATGGINEFYIVNVATPTNITLSGSLNLTGNVNSIYVSGNFAYVATSITTAELTVINVTNKALPTSAGVYDAAGTVAATDVFAVGTTVYITRLNNTAGAEFFILNASTPAAVSLVGSFEMGGNVNGVCVTGTQAFLATAVTARRLAVLNIATPATPTLLGSLDTGAINNDIYVINDVVYIASTDDVGELTIVQREASGSGYQAYGTYESATYDLGGNRGINYLVYTAAVPAGTTVRFQVAANYDNATWNFVGPDGTGSTFYTEPGAIPLNMAGARYVRYRAVLTGNMSVTPVVQDVTVNYSL